jgi:hypothetical protein
MPTTRHRIRRQRTVPNAIAQLQAGLEPEYTYETFELLQGMQYFAEVDYGFTKQEIDFLMHWQRKHEARHRAVAEQRSRHFRDIE